MMKFGNSERCIKGFSTGFWRFGIKPHLQKLW